MKIKNKEPLLTLGPREVHVVYNYAKAEYRFVGLTQYKDKSGFETLEEAIDAFVEWYNSLRRDDRYRLADKLRKDIFDMIFPNGKPLPRIIKGSGGNVLKEARDLEVDDVLSNGIVVTKVEISNTGKTVFITYSDEYEDYTLRRKANTLMEVKGWLWINEDGLVDVHPYTPTNTP